MDMAIWPKGIHYLFVNGIIYQCVEQVIAKFSGE